MILISGDSILSFYIAHTWLSTLAADAEDRADLDGFSDDLRDSLLTYIELRKNRVDQE